MIIRKRVLILLILVLFLLSNIVFANDIKIGTVINKVLSTDIIAYINGNKIPSMNIDGYTAVVAEDLRNYGFDVIWNPIKRSLTISENITKNINPILVQNNENTVIGEKVADVLYTDIKTYLNGREVEAFNIGGYTAIFLKELETYGSVTWNEESREIRFISDKLGDNENEKNNDYFFKVDLISSDTIDIKNVDNTFTYNGEKVGFIDKQDNGYRCMISGNFLAERYGYNITVENGYYIFEKDGYSFKISDKNNEYQKYYNGWFWNEWELCQKPMVIDGEIFIYDCDLPGLFGLHKYWDPDDNSIRLIYNDYDVKEYGYFEIQGYKFIVKSYGQVQAVIKDRTLGFDDKYGNASGNSIEQIAYIQLEHPVNELDIALNYNGRILLLKKLTDIIPNIKTQTIEKERIVGPFSYVMINNPEAGYIEIENSDVYIDGEITSANGDSIVVEIEKYDDETKKFIKYDTQEINLKENHFEGYVHFNDHGIYRVIPIANINSMHGIDVNVKVFEFYVKY